MTRYKELDKITDFLKVIFASGNIDEKPLSCLLIAPVSSGKTTAIKQFKKNKNLLITTDSTAYGILKKYENMLKNREIRHIIVPDLLNSMARRKSTQDQLFLFINSTSEDGIFPSVNYGMEIRDYIDPFGWVLCITTEGFRRKKRFLNDIGFLSRFFVLEYSYSADQIACILERLASEEVLEIADIKMKTKKKPVKIKGDPKIFRELIPYSKLLCKDSESEIIRMQKKLQVFLKASAHLRGDTKVKKEDLEKLKSLIDMIK